MLRTLIDGTECLSIFSLGINEKKHINRKNCMNAVPL